MICTVEGCNSPAKARRMCSRHYQQWKKTATFPTREERLWARIDKTDTCWLWTGTILQSGYGQIRWNAKQYRVHRFVYELLVGPIPEGLTLDHLCRVRHCVNPAHLEPVTMRENLLRSSSFVAINARKTHCPQGHPFDSENTLVYKGSRVCRACRNAKALAYYYAKRRAG